MVLKQIYRFLFLKSLNYPKLVICNICKWSGRRFLDDYWLKRISCPNCHSDIRHRLLLFSLINKSLLTKELLNKKVLHFAPESFLVPYFKRNSNYLTADYNRTDVDLNVDISNMNYIPDGQYDLIIASDVLEHVYDDMKAIFEIYRILKVGGIAILTVPQKDHLKTTIENLSDLSSEEREIQCGQKDHYRIYGYDFLDKLMSVEFKVEIFDAQTVPNKLRKKYVLSPPILGKHPMVTNYRKIYHAIKIK